ncbi:NACHT domain-containing protein [Plantactinospora siamensis]|uniref:NACHT domain-containing protein n=1 Tax=Plantactinospora siamensis TaxID=555372 RepID=A0ABV6P002_9ACTN
MPDTLSYADAVRLLGGKGNRWVDLIDKITGGALLSAAIPVPGLAGLVDAKVGLVRLGRDLLREVSERRSGLSRYDRTRRLEAAHAVIAVTAYFEALAEAELPIPLAELDLTRAEQLSLGGARPADPLSVLQAFFDVPAPVPGPHLPYPAVRRELAGYYADLGHRFMALVIDLTVGDRAAGVPSAPELWRLELNRVAMAAQDRHRELLARLAADFPEVAFWIGLDEHEATRGEVRELATGLVELRAALDRISSRTPPDDRRGALATAYADELTRPIAQSGDVPAGLRLPTLGGAYVSPLFRLAELGADARPADDGWWADRPVRDDLADFLTGQLTAPGAVHAPLLVLGQPGSGKSVLTKILAAQLPAADFLVVRVVLRDVPAAAGLQEQLEQAVRDATGERLDWPALSRSAGGALPVVLLDGFDELLQATGVSQSDYLTRVAEFQRRELALGRPVAVLVTSRTSVADRARPPAGAVAVRLEPFDGARVRRWLQTWNAVNAGAPGFRPVDPDTILVHRDLAEQPLLLLMLALYDAGGGDLRSAGDLRQGELYERLLRDFGRREIEKHRAGLLGRDLDRAVEEELRRLSVVAFAMFNRRAQWVTEAELEADLAALPFGGAAVVARDDRRTPLRAAEIVLGRFFFVHRSQATRDADRPTAYEFLHATFGEYLVARLSWLVVDNLVDRESASTLSFAGTPVDDDLLQALLSYAVLTGRAPIVGFLAERLAGLDETRRAGWTELLVRLFRAVHHTAAPRRYDGYAPLRLPVPARYAAYSANLLVLAVCAAGEIGGRQLYPDADDLVQEWHAQALLWRSQLDAEGWSSLVDTLTLDRRWDGDRREIMLRIGDRPAPPAPVDTHWTYNLGPDLRQTTQRRWSYNNVGQEQQVLRRKANFECGASTDVVQHALEPLAEALPGGLHVMVGREGEPLHSITHLALALWSTPPQDRVALYRRCVRAVVLLDDLGSSRDVVTFLRLVLDQLSIDTKVSPQAAVEILDLLSREVLTPELFELSEPLLRCCLAFLDVELRRADMLADLVEEIIEDKQHARHLWTTELALEARVRLFELGFRALLIAPDDVDRLTTLHRQRRPDLLERIKPLIRSAGSTPDPAT